MQARPWPIHSAASGGTPDAPIGDGSSPTRAWLRQRIGTLAPAATLGIRAAQMSPLALTVNIGMLAGCSH